MIGNIRIETGVANSRRAVLSERRADPWCDDAMRYGGRPAISRPRKRIEPRFDGRVSESGLRIVRSPEPFGSADRLIQAAAARTRWTIGFGDSHNSHSNTSEQEKTS